MAETGASGTIVMFTRPNPKFVGHRWPRSAECNIAGKIASNPPRSAKKLQNAQRRSNSASDANQVVAHSHMSPSAKDPCENSATNKLAGLISAALLDVFI